MESLQNVIASLQTEILAGLARGQSPLGPVRLVADRVILSLNFVVREEKSSAAGAVYRFEALSQCEKYREPSGAERPHTLTVEYKMAQNRTVEASVPADESFQTAETTDLSATSSEKLVEALSSVFGTPGFDSSARATVFREALSGLAEEQVHVLRDMLGGRRALDRNSPAAHSVHLLSRLADTGPAGPGQGRRVLGEILSHYPVEFILCTVDEKWKTQDDWLD